MGWLWRRLDAKQVGSSGATSRGSPELKPTGKRWGAAPRYFPALKTGGNFEAQQAPWWPSGTPQAGPPQKKFWLRLRAARCWRAAGSMPPAARAVPAGGFAPQIPRGLWADRRTPSFFGKLPNVEPLSLPSQKHGSIFSPHWPVDFCAPKRLVFGFAACGAWICRLRHLSFACACACLALDLFVLVFFLFACGARTSSVQITLASLASVHRRRQNASNTQLFISYRSAAAPKAARISCCCWQIVWFAVCLFTAGRLRCHLVKQPLPAALDTGAGGAGVGVATRSGASRCSYL